MKRVSEIEKADLLSAISIEPKLKGIMRRLLMEHDTLLSGEQAWEEESLHLQERLNGIGVKEFLTLQYEHNRTKTKLNQAVEVLKWYADKENYRLRNPKEYDNGAFADYHVMGDEGMRARDFLSQEKGKVQIEDNRKICGTFNAPEEFTCRCEPNECLYQKAEESHE